jgi:predicted nucleic acid-binding protein
MPTEKNLSPQKLRSTAFVVDFSIAITWLFHDEATPKTAALLNRLATECRTHRLTNYDAIYLDLAIRRSLPLAMIDDDLRRAAKKLGVGLLG